MFILKFKNNFSKINPLIDIDSTGKNNDFYSSIRSVLLCLEIKTDERNSRSFEREREREREKQESPTTYRSPRNKENRQSTTCD